MLFFSDSLSVHDHGLSRKINEMSPSVVTQMFVQSPSRREQLEQRRVNFKSRHFLMALPHGVRKLQSPGVKSTLITLSIDC